VQSSQALRGYPKYIIIRGNNREPVFASNQNNQCGQTRLISTELKNWIRVATENQINFKNKKSIESDPIDFGFKTD